MMKTYINSVDFSEYVSDGSIRISEQIQNKANTLSCSLYPGSYTIPNEDQEILIYDAVEIVSVVSTALTVKDKLRSGLSITTFGKYRVGDFIRLGIGTSDLEKRTITAIGTPSNGQLVITLDSAPDNTHGSTDIAGKLIFGGTLTQVKTSNPKLLTDVEVGIQATDFTKIFDRKNVNDSWSNFDARQIINDALNTTINYNLPIDNMDYADNTAIQAEWIESGSADPALVTTSDFIQGTAAGQFPWTTGVGDSEWSATPTSTDLSDLVGVSSGTPTKGNLTCWIKTADISAFTSIKIQIGSDSSNYAEVTLDPPDANNQYQFYSFKLSKATITGTPDWTAIDFDKIIVADTADGSVLIDDIRVTADGSFTMFNFQPTDTFDDVRSSFKKPTVLLDQLCKFLNRFWYIDYERDIHSFSQETNAAPIAILDTSDNFEDLSIDVDSSQLKNRQVVRGGTERSDSFYTQVVQGDNAVREWTLKSQFAELEIYLDDNSSTDTMEAGTTTTNVTATAHGLSDGDWIVNRTRSAARKITYVDPDNFTVATVDGQTTGDTFSKFATQQDVGVEFLTDETTVDYVSNFQEKTIRASSTTGTLTDSEYLLYKYKEIIPIQIIARDNTSIARMKSLVGGDGIFDGSAIEDATIDSRTEARERARAEIRQYANPIVKVSFKTDQEGLHAGQVVTIEDTNKGISGSYLIQKVKIDYKTGDFPMHTVQCASSLFGLIEYFQKIAERIKDKSVDDNELITQIASESPTITLADVNATTPAEVYADTVTTAEAEADYIDDPPLWVYAPYQPSSLLADRKRPLHADRDNMTYV